MNQIAAIETPVETETETVMASVAGTIGTEEKVVTVAEDETVETTDHDRETDATTRTIAPHLPIINDETAEGTETEAAEINAEDETALDERALADTTIEMIVMAITETEDVRRPKDDKPYPLLANQKQKHSKLSRRPPPLSLSSPPPIRPPHPSSSREQLPEAPIRHHKADRHKKPFTPPRPRPRLQAEKRTPFAEQDGPGRIRRRH